MTDTERTVSTNHDTDAWRFTWSTPTGEFELHWRLNTEVWQRFVRLADPDGSMQGWSEQQVALPRPRDEQHAARVAEAHATRRTP